MKNLSQHITESFISEEMKSRDLIEKAISKMKSKDQIYLVIKDASGEDDFFEIYCYENDLYQLRSSSISKHGHGKAIIFNSFDLNGIFHDYFIRPKTTLISITEKQPK